MTNKTKKVTLISVIVLALILSIFLMPKSLFCKHLEYTEGICNNCKEACVHEFNNTGICNICASPCNHTYENGTCTICQFECIHTWENTICKTCNIQCTHPQYTEGICNICTYECPHETYENNACKVCLKECLHESFTDNICNECAYECPHEQHSENKGECLLCKTPVFHNYVNGSCTVCNRTPVFYDNFLPDEFYEENENKGEIHVVEYKAKNYFANDTYNNKTMKIWTPYNYDENIKYNVLVLMHGGGGTCDNWIDRTFRYGDRAIKLCNIYDRIVEKNNTAPFIIVSIPAQNNDTQIAGELRDSILPYVVENFSTWAEDSSVEAIVAARDHFGIGGLSNGSLHTFDAGMSKSYDLFGNYMGLSGNGKERLVEATITSDEYKDLSVRCLFSGCGTSDGLIRATSYGYNHIVEVSNGRYVEGTNAWYQDTAGGHNWKVWSIEVYNALLVMF